MASPCPPRFHQLSPASPGRADAIPNLFVVNDPQVHAQLPVPPERSPCFSRKYSDAKAGPDEFGDNHQAFAIIITIVAPQPKGRPCKK